MHILILGAGAGGGLPQWNCNCPVCRLAWDGDDRVFARTQSAIAASADGVHWALINCSPDLRQQIIATPRLHPRDPETYGRRDTPIDAVVLTNADVDHIAGLLTLREKQRFALFATTRILDVLDRNGIFSVLDPECVDRREFALGSPVEIAPGLEVEAFTVPGKVALFLEGDAGAQGEGLEIGAETEDTIGLRLAARGSDKAAYYIPGCAAMTDRLNARLKGADLVLFDGTVWQDDEMISHGVGQKTGHRMGHMSMAGPDGSLAAFADLDVGRKIYIHINNTNPVLVEDSPERAQVRDSGWDVAHDGMELVV
ncbi:MAG: pyrroloquinoline quinone biosynthesis protein PqqB [Hyphomicrobiales bacterium]